MFKKYALILGAMFVMLNMCFSICFANGYIPKKEELTPSVPTTDVETVAGKIIGLLSWVGYAVAVGMIAFVGIKYVISSADEKASMKGALVKVLIGAVIVAAASAIVTIVFNASQVSS